jgi:hypothetical protein
VNDWKIIPTIVITTVLIFGAGVFCGGFLVDFVKQTPSRSAAKKPPVVQPAPTNTVAITTNVASASGARPPSPPQVLSKDFLQRLDSDIHLTKEQHDAVQKIITDGQNEMRKVLQDARLEIREVLTPEQQDQFDKLMKRPFHKPLFGTNAPPNIATNAPASNVP